ncbi:expressed unknown protein [Seminavis robusta]|uniref:Uncharacterized protein n=1 Tax=Seminavis robusta TaxID=568900 RepID=A0A9N8DJR7_9STRA|nr:expressed unknown protein [Seminavis robusta]|eukprot:Sro179_g078570.1 n/a (634) ;mRNA; r:69489-71481
MVSSSQIRHVLVALLLQPFALARPQSNIRSEFVRAMNEATQRTEESKRQTALMSRLLQKAKVVKTAFTTTTGGQQQQQRPHNHEDRKLYDYNYQYGYYNYQYNYNNQNGNGDDNYNYNQQQEQQVGDDFWAEYGGLNLTNYALKYLGCQNIHSFSDEKAADNDEGGVLAMNRFVVFRLCPKHTCSNYNEYGCDYNYGEYTLPMDDYLATMQTYHIEQYQTYCKTCASCMSGSGDYNNVNRERELNNGGGGQYYYYKRYNGDGTWYYNNYGNANNDDNYNANDDQGNYQNYNGNYDDFYAAADDDGGNNNNNYANNDDGGNNAAANDDGGGGGGGDDDGGNDDAGAAANNATATCSYADVCASYQQACGPEMYNDDNYLSRAEAYAEYFECTELDVGGAVSYLGPHCRSDGFTIGIGIYEDEYCSSYVGDVVDLQQVTGLKYEDDYLSPYYPKQCISCTARESYDLVTDDEIQNEENEGLYEVCGVLYEQAAKCNRYLGEDDTYQGQFEQEANEQDVCNFVASLVENNYDEYGEAILESPEWTLAKWKSINAYRQDLVRTSSGQILGIVFSVGLVAALAIYAIYLRYKLTRRLPWSLGFGKSSAADQAGKIGRVSSGITMQRSMSGLEPRGSFA